MKRKARLVKFEKTKKGSTVIHRQLDLSSRSFIVPQRTNYEENLQPIPPLIYVNDTTNLTCHQTSSLLPLESSLDIENKWSSLDQVEQKSRNILPFHFTTSLSSIREEPEEIETSNERLSNQDSLAKQHLIDTKTNMTEYMTPDYDEELSKRCYALREVVSNSLTTTDFDEIRQKEIDENKPITYPSPSSDDSSSALSTPNEKDSMKFHTLKQENLNFQKKSSRKKYRTVITEQTEDVQQITTKTDRLFSAEMLNIEHKIEEIQQAISIPPENAVIYHKVGRKLKSKKKTKKKLKKMKQINLDVDDRIKKQKKQIETKSEEEEILILNPRKAVPFISANKDKQIEVEDDLSIKYKKKKRKRSSKLL